MFMDRKDDRLTFFVTKLNDLFLYSRKMNLPNLNREIATCHHDGVAGVDRLSQAFERSGALELGDQGRAGTDAPGDGADGVQIGVQGDVPVAIDEVQPAGRILEGVGGVSELMQDDGIHPRAEAQPRLLDNVWPVLEPLL